MAFITGLLLIDAPASALNNAGPDEGARTDNTIAVKCIRVGRRGQTYPYVSAQAFRYWLRTKLEREGNGWRSSPVLFEKKVAYSDGNPIDYWDDDLFGYMRAESKKADAKDRGGAQGTPTSREITRAAPFRVGTLVSIAPVHVVYDFGTMARQERDPVPYEHQFYRATLKGLLSLDLRSAGTFFAGERVGFRNLDEHRVRLAEERGLVPVVIHGQRAYRLPTPERAERVAALLRGLADLEGGAKLTLHYTDVTPAVAFFAVTRGGNHPFQRVIGADQETGEPVLAVDALKEVLRVYRDQILSPLYVGWAAGFHDDQRERLAALTEEDRAGVAIHLGHPREAILSLAEAVRWPENAAWFA